VKRIPYLGNSYPVTVICNLIATPSSQRTFTTYSSPVSRRTVAVFPTAAARIRQGRAIGSAEGGRRLALLGRTARVGHPRAIAVLAVKAKPLRGRCASLDRSARRWRLVCKSRC